MFFGKRQYIIRDFSKLCFIFQLLDPSPQNWSMQFVDGMHPKVLAIATELFL